MAKMKLKTLSGAKKRFKMTASGKIKRNATKRRHPDQEDHQAHPRPAHAQVCRQDQRGCCQENDALRRLIALRQGQLT